MEEKKQKKIKASPRPGKLAGYMIGLKKSTRKNFPAPAGAFSSIKGRKDDPDDKRGRPRGVCDTPLQPGTRQKNTSDIHCYESLTLLPYPNSVEMSDSPQ